MQQTGDKTAIDEPVDVRAHVRELAGRVLGRRDRTAASRDAVAQFFVSLKLGETVGDRFPFAEADSRDEVEQRIAARWVTALRGQSTLDDDGQLVEELLKAVGFVLGFTRETAAKKGIAEAIRLPGRPPLGRQALADALLEKTFGSDAVADLIAEVKRNEPPSQEG